MVMNEIENDIFYHFKHYKHPLMFLSRWIIVTMLTIGIITPFYDKTRCKPVCCAG